MATRCPICGKKPMMANKRKLLRGNYNIVNRYKKTPNLQWSRMEDGSRMKICTSCIKTKNKVRVRKTFAKTVKAVAQPL